MPNDKTALALGRARRPLAQLLHRGLALFDDKARESVKTARYASFNAQRYVDAHLAPAVTAALDINKTVAGGVLDALRGDRDPAEVFFETSQRARAGLRFSSLVQTLGKELFGSARYDGETVIAADAHYRLSYLPPKAGVTPQPFDVFHAAGAIPYGDRLFRFLPEANFYQRFLDRGIGVYAMELAGDRDEVDYSAVTLASLIDSFERLSERAFEHGRGRRMVLEGYCGHGMQALAYVAAKPRDAERKFALLATFVSPIDGRECADLAELMALTPDMLRATGDLLERGLGGYFPADAARKGLDTSLKLLFNKTRFGYFAAGWSKAEYAAVQDAGSLTPAQRAHLAGAYWISPEGSRRFPLPNDIVRYGTRLFTQGIAPNGDLPVDYRGRALSLRDILGQTRLRMIGIFGGLDRVVPDRTAFGLAALFGERYRHVVHPFAGHVSYVMTPGVWSPGTPFSLSPNPIDLMIEEMEREAAVSRRMAS